MFGILDVNTKRNSNISNLYLTLASNSRYARSRQNVPTITDTDALSAGSNMLDGRLPSTLKHDQSHLGKKISEEACKKFEDQFISESTCPINTSKTTSYRLASGKETHSSNHLRSAVACTNNNVSEIAAFIFVSVFALASFPWLCFTVIGSILLLILAFSFISLTAFWLFSLVYISVGTFSLVFALILLARRLFP